VTEGEREQRIGELVEVMGIDREEAERRLLDGDLWLVEPALRAGLDGDEAVEEWEWAAGFAQCLENGFAFTGWAPVATSQLIIDMRMRAEEALQRARRLDPPWEAKSSAAGEGERCA
jgi:hypothetical protein